MAFFSQENKHASQAGSLEHVLKAGQPFLRQEGKGWAPSCPPPFPLALYHSPCSLPAPPWGFLNKANQETTLAMGKGPSHSLRVESHPGTPTTQRPHSHSLQLNLQTLHWAHPTRSPRCTTGDVCSFPAPRVSLEGTSTA